MDEMTRCNVKSVTHSYIPQRTITNSAVLICSTEIFSHCFGFAACNFTVGSVSPLSQAAVFSKKPPKPKHSRALSN